MSAKYVIPSHGSLCHLFSSAGALCTPLLDISMLNNPAQKVETRVVEVVTLGQINALANIDICFDEPG